jgi:murein DD-endopeptidase MepM/ murein hydrolase activator NlpD
LLNASVGVQRVLGRLRRPPSRPASPVRGLRSRSHAVATRIDRGLHASMVRVHLVPGRMQPVPVEGAKPRRRRSLAGRIGHDRVLAVAVAGILVGASVISVSAGGRSGPTGGPTGDGPAPRIAVGGGVDQGNDGHGVDVTADGQDSTGDVAGDSSGDANGDWTGDVSGDVAFGDPDPAAREEPRFAAVDFGDEQIEPEAPVSVEGPFIDDGTLVKPVAVDTTVPDGSALVKTYTVKAGDTLAEIATQFRVSTMSVWWANDLKAKSDIKPGRVLHIPPVTGLIVRVTPTDTLDGLAAKYGVNSTDILATNGLDDPNLVVGQVLVVPGAKGKPIPPPKPRVKPTSRPSSGGGGGSVRPPATYRGGSFLWPVVGGGNYISQYFHYGHYGLDIAADYGSTVRAAGSGTVIFAGWKSNGGGYQVWVAHGSGLYTTYNHMSAVSVGRGQHVGRGSQVGRVGQSGYATGPHLHFEVWRGPVWDGGRRVNPLAYL